MEEDGIQVNTGAFSVVGNWLGDVSKAGAAIRSDSAVSETKPGKRGRLGLGAEEPVKPKEETALEKKVKRKRQRNDMQEGNDMQMHGVAEDLEESRVAAVSNKRAAVLGWAEDRSGDAQLPLREGNTAEDQATTTKRKNKKKKKTQQQGQRNTQPQEQQEQQPHAKQQQAEVKEDNADSTAESKNMGDAVGSNSNAQADGTFKRKRTKKRSRQKNIRKDKRKDEDKPEYLRIGAAEYLGRELTEETRKKLGLPVTVDATAA